MQLDPQIAIAAFATLAAGWLMMVAGLQKSALEHRRRRRVCPSCGREIQARVCATCAA
jgi:formate dehydrogenase maturation protein FdhE